MSDSMSVPHQHHHHFYSHAHAEGPGVGPAHHLHHHHFQPQTSATSSVSESSMSTNDPRCCSSCRCSNRLLTGIVITILPIAITSTLICVFMMQKTNLHQYAIYSFVIFCVAFVFPFALFFFTVVLNKIYKFYKREIRSIPPNHLNAMLADNCDAESGPVQHSSNYNQSIPSGVPTGPVPGRALLVNSNSCQSGQSASLICYSSRAYHPYYYHMEDGTIVAYAPDSSLMVEDSPPSYEMALLCPSVTHHQYPSTFINAPIQVILPREQCKPEKVPPESSSPRPADQPPPSTEPAEDNHSESSAQNASEQDALPKSLDSGQNEPIPTG